MQSHPGISKLAEAAVMGSKIIKVVTEGMNAPNDHISYIPGP